MSRAVIILNETEIPISVIGKIKEITNIPLGDIKNAINGQRPIIDEKLFYNNHDEIADKIKRLLALLQDEKVGFSVYEIDENEVIENRENLEVDNIDEETLINILDSHSNRFN